MRSLDDPRVRAAIGAYLRALDESQVLGISSVWLYGSVALDAYHHGRSDIDVVALVAQPVDDEALFALHARARAFELDARWMQGIYVTSSELNSPWRAGALPLVDHLFDPPPYPRVRLLPTTRACVLQCGVTLFGEPPDELLMAPDLEDVRAECLEKLESILDEPAEAFLNDYWIDFGLGMAMWRAGCGESRTSGSEGGPRKRTKGNLDTAPRSDPYADRATPLRARSGRRAWAWSRRLKPHPVRRTDGIQSRVPL